MEKGFSSKIQYLKSRLGELWRAGAVHIISGNFLNKFVAFFGSIFIIRVLTKADYGTLRYFENLYNFPVAAAGLGISNAVMRFVVLEDDIQRKKSVFRYMIKVALLANLAIIAIGYVVNTFYPHASNFKDYSFLLYIMLLMLPAQYLCDNNLTLQRSMFDNRRFAYFNLGYAILVICGKLTGALVGGLQGVVILGVAIQVLTATFLMYTNNKRYFSGVSVVPVENTKKKEILTYSVQYMITNGMWTLFMLMDGYLVGKMINNPEVVAEYNVAITWPSNISVIGTAVAFFVTPYFIQHENDFPWIRTNFKKLYGVNLGIVGFLALIMLVFTKPLLFIYSGRDYYNVIPLMRLMVLPAFINNGFRFMVANCLAAMGKIRTNMIVSFAGLIGLTILDILLIPRFQQYGPPIADTIVFSLMALVLFIDFNKKYKIIGSRKEEA